ncbi:MAG: tetratricopeptide repeat protein [Acidimicrobiia bacterium]|nr:tetratricopeptide repeat protein [Acidimicrobiia bacterium]
MSRRARPAAFWLLPCLALLFAIPAGAAPQRGLTGAAGLARAYDLIFSARFDEARDAIDAACPSAPPEACLVLETAALWWRIQIDPQSRRHDARFDDLVTSAVTATEAWTTREPERAEAWLYRGGAYGARAQWLVLRGRHLAAARDGSRIKNALERALALDPGMQDAWFGIGLYHYYADVAPAALRMLRWLLLLPGGDRERGLEEMLRAREGGVLLGGEADYQLHVLYLWYERAPDRALDLLRGLRDRHPENPHFAQLIADVQDVYLHDATASLRTWEALAAAARAGRVVERDLALTVARLGMAQQLDHLFETDRAIEELEAVIASGSTAPFGAQARARLQLGDALARLGDREGALQAYLAAEAAARTADPGDVARRARRARALRPVPDAEARAYRLSLDGWRALARGDVARAASALAEARALHPGDPVIAYRHARALLAERREREAAALLDHVLGLRDTTPPTVYAAACVDRARLHERQEAPARAIELYRRAQRVFGADRETIRDADAALARLDRH